MVWPLPQTLRRAVSEGEEVQPKMSPVGVMMAEERRRGSRTWATRVQPASFRAGSVKARALPSPKRPTSA